MSAFTADGTENRMRWDRRSRGFMEVWYATVTHRGSGAGIWLRYTLTSPTSKDRPPYCELWGFFFDPDGKRSFGAKTRFPIDRLGGSNGRDDGALVRIADAWLSETHLEGILERDGRSLSWSLDLDPAERCFHHLPEGLRTRIEKRVSTVCSPNLAVPFSGTVVLDGDEIPFDEEPGSQSHRWGRRHSHSWAWTHCSEFDEGRQAVFEAVAARTAFGPVPTPTLTFCYLQFEGVDIPFNAFKWALRAKSRYEMPTWAFTARNESWKITGAARASVDRLMQATYTDPDGSARYCANSEISDLALELYRREGALWRHIASLTSLRKAHVEFGRREPFVEVPIVV